MGRVILYIAISLDGYIAAPDGGVGWLDGFEIEGEDYGYQDFFDSLGSLIIGGKTYRQVLGFGEWPYHGVTTYVITRQESIDKPDESVIPYSGDISDLMEEISQNSNKDIWLVGGGEVNAAFLRQSLIDEYIISVMPVLLGDGIPLVKSVESSKSLELTGSKVYPNGVVQLRYVNQS